MKRLLLRALLQAFCSVTLAADRPNILWLTAEDMSPQLGSYGDREGRTPRLDVFARAFVQSNNLPRTAKNFSVRRNFWHSKVAERT